MKDKTILFVDPMSYHNLALYDYNLLLHIKHKRLIFGCNKKFDLSIPHTIYHLFSYQEYTLLRKILSYVFSMIKILVICEKMKVNLVHFQWLKFPFFDYIIIKILKYRKIKVVYTAHNALPHDSGKKYMWIYKLIYHEVDKVICHTHYAQVQLKYIFSLQNTVVIPHGLLDLKLLQEDSDIDLNLISHLENADGIVFSFLGNISNYKGIDIVVETWLSSNALKKSNAKLLIAGSGVIPNIEKLSLCENVLLLNRMLNNNELQFCINHSDFILMPYKEISQSGLLLTVLTNRKKVIVSNLPPLIEPFEFISNDLGYILEENTSDNLKAILEQILINREKGVLLSEKIFEELSEYYSWEKIGVKTLQLYTNLLKNKCKRVV